MSDLVLPEIHTILIDMDEVLVNSHAIFAQVAKKDPYEFDKELAVLKIFGLKHKFIFPLIFKAIDLELFSIAPPTNFTVALKHNILEYWTKTLGIKVEILTSTMKENPKRQELQQQKLSWLSSHDKISELKVNFAVGSEDKQNFAKPGVLLIDDFDRTIGQFIYKGGYGLHYTNLTEVLVKLKLLGLLPSFN